MRKSDSKGLQINVQRRGETATVQIDAVDASGQFLNGAETKLTLIAPKLGESKLVAEQVAPGRYEATIKTDQPGAYQVQIAQSKDGVALHQQSRGLIVGYPDELRLRPTNDEFLKAISRATGGTFEPAASDGAVSAWSAAWRDTSRSGAARRQSDGGAGTGYRRATRRSDAR